MSKTFTGCHPDLMVFAEFMLQIIKQFPGTGIAAYGRTANMDLMTALRLGIKHRVILDNPINTAFTEAQVFCYLLDMGHFKPMFGMC
jgi:hypothetical protein